MPFLLVYNFIMLNRSLLNIEKENTFSKSTRLVKEYKLAHPDADVISLGIGDVSMPIIEPVRNAMKKAVDDLGSMDTFKGYGLYFGLEELRQTILDNEYKGLGLSIDEIYIGDGTKSDSTNILELFDKDSKVLIGNPIYPIYENGAYAYQRELHFGEVDEEFKLKIPKEKYDIIYLCSPANPIGNALTREELKEWIDYANKNKSVIIFDNVYKSFVESDNVPLTAYEVEGAKKCIIEMRSFSKDLSFSSSRCSYYVIPNEIDEDINYYWKERTTNRFNGTSYVSQKGAIAAFSDESKKLIKENIKKYKDNIKYLREELNKLGYSTIGGYDSPYLWVKTKNNMTSWEAFDYFLTKLNIVVVPGEVFGSNGKYNFRISGLGSIENSKRAIERIKKYEENI